MSRAVLAALLAVGLLAGCGGRKMEIPDLPPVGEVPPIASSPNNATFALSKVVVTIKRGTETARFPVGMTWSGGRGVVCNTGEIRRWVEVWTSGRTNIGDWRYPLGEIFFEVLTDKRFSVAGDPNDLFKRRDAVASAEYLIGARVAEMRSNYCEYIDPRKHSYSYAGETYVRIEWTVFSSLSQQAILVHETAGYHQIDDSETYGKSILFQQAFADALRRLAKHPDFRGVATREFQPRDRSDGGRGRIVLPGGKLKTRDIGKDLDGIGPTVATIHAGRARSGGFIVGTGGYLLTNAHAVGASRTVRVILSNGVEVDGKVLRTNTARDLALVKIPIRSPASLPIRLTRTKPGERVYAVSGPAGDDFRATVLRGTVGGLRTDPMTGNGIIESDVALPQSGGLLLDRFGNVVGIDVSGPGGRGGVGLFLPIAEALAAVNVTIELD